MSNEVSVMLSIRSPGLTAKILSGEKTIEVRKTRPNKVATPFKCYIYCTKGYREALWFWKRAEYAYCMCNGHKKLTRPLQSWCYVEEKDYE